MCGIVGEDFTKNKRDMSLLAMKRATLKQQRREPDGSGLYVFDNLALGHGRLKIFDLSNRAMQPMIDHTLGLAIVFKGGGKYILKQLGRQLLPKEVVDRPKGYFPVPALKHLNGNMLELMHDVLSLSNVKKRGIFNPSVIQKMFNSPKNYFTPTGASKLWQLGLLEYWLKKQNIGN